MTRWRMHAHATNRIMYCQQKLPHELFAKLTKDAPYTRRHCNIVMGTRYVLITNDKVHKD